MFDSNQLVRIEFIVIGVKAWGLGNFFEESSLENGLYVVDFLVGERQPGRDLFEVGVSENALKGLVGGRGLFLVNYLVHSILASDK